jgi:hypothetical protein
MKSIVVRYQAKPDRADENQQLIEAVFADLAARQPKGFTYKVFGRDRRRRLRLKIPRILASNVCAS